MRRKFACRIDLVLVFLALCFVPSLASAQTVSQYTTSTAGGIADSPSCVTNLTRTFSVATSLSVTDVDFGVLLTHNYRSDLRITLISPAGTSVQVMNATGGGGSNLNVLFDDEAATAIGSHTSNDLPSGAPPYSKTFRPGGALSAFDGENGQGTWTMVICDFVAVDTGTFTRADLYITQAPVVFADLSLTKSVSNFRPNVGAIVTYGLTITNASASNTVATGVSVLDVLPSGVLFLSATGTGSYNSTTGVWTVGSLAPGVSASINVAVMVVAANGTMITNGAEVLTSSAQDPDSSPNNGSTEEDDDAFVSLTVGSARTAGTPPPLICPLGSTLFDWDNVSWTAGSTNNNYPVTSVGSINFNLAIIGGVYNFNSGNGGQSPARQTNFNGGTVPAQNSLLQLVDFSSQSGTATATITLPTAVPGMQFRLFDVDYAVNEFADRVTVTGIFNGVSVLPTLTNGVSNYVIGNSAFGDSNVPNDNSGGSVVVTFTSPVDTVIVSYGNHNIAPTNPIQQGVAIHDLNFCRPQSNVSVSKTSVVISDGVSNSNPKAVPGAIVRYCILANNTGSAAARDFNFADIIPDALTYVPGSMLSGSNCSATKTTEDDDALGSDESDPIGASVSGNTITVTATSLPADSSFAFAFGATVK